MLRAMECIFLWMCALCLGNTIVSAMLIFLMASVTSQCPCSNQVRERAPLGFGNSDSRGKSHCFRIFLFLPPSPPAHAHPSTSSSLFCCSFSIKKCLLYMAEESCQEGMLTALIWGENRQQVHCHPGERKMVLPQKFIFS